MRLSRQVVRLATAGRQVVRLSTAGRQVVRLSTAGPQVVRLSAAGRQADLQEPRRLLQCLPAKSTLLQSQHLPGNSSPLARKRITPPEQPRRKALQ